MRIENFSLTNIPGRRDTFVLNEAPLKQIDRGQDPKDESVAGCSKVIFGL